MKTRAAVAFEAKKPLEIVELDLDGPKQGEVLVEIMATGICHTDAYTLDGFDSEGIFPSILGHEGAGVVVGDDRDVLGQVARRDVVEVVAVVVREQDEVQIGQLVDAHRRFGEPAAAQAVAEGCVVTLVEEVRVCGHDEAAEAEQHGGRADPGDRDLLGSRPAASAAR